MSILRDRRRLQRGCWLFPRGSRGQNEASRLPRSRSGALWEGTGFLGTGSSCLFVCLFPWLQMSLLTLLPDVLPHQRCQITCATSQGLKISPTVIQKKHFFFLPSQQVNFSQACHYQDGMLTQTRSSTSSVVG